MKAPAELATLFRSHGLKVTPQRERIFRVLHDNPMHPAAEAVHAAVVADMPTVSLRTVYQTLNDLASMGEISPMDVGTGATRFDPNTGEHQHLVCRECGSIVDIEIDVSSLRPPEHDSGFRIDTTEVLFRGICGDCAGRSTSTQTPQKDMHHA